MYCALRRRTSLADWNPKPEYSSSTEATAICSEGLNSNSIVYDGRIVFKLGTCEKLEKKIHQGLAACAQLDQDNPSVKGTLRLTGEKQYYFTED